MNKIKNYDIIIAGSGPAGSSAAYYLAKEGLKVLILEKEKLPRYKTCGGGLTFRGLSFLPFDLDEISGLKCFTAEINDYESNIQFVTERSKPAVIMTMRSDLDYKLIKEAKKNGAEIRDNCELKEINYVADGIEVVASEDKLFAKFLIGADGALSKTAKLGGWKNFKKLIPALEYEIFVGDKDLSNNSHSVRFDFGIVHGGYGWVFPKKDHLSVGVLSMNQNKPNLNKILQIYLEKIGIKKVIKSERHGFVIPMSPTAKELARKRILLTGDAAGFVDPVTCEGISYAILSGKLAAESLIKNSLNENISEAFYNDKISKVILPELNCGKRLSFFIYKNSAIRRLVFKLYGEKLSELITDVIMGERTYSEILKSPANYLKLFNRWSLKYFRGNINSSFRLNSR